MEHIRVIYIMGRGHSGSTFLDVLLGNVDGVESVGEVISGLNRGGGEFCGCRRSVADCAFWGRVCDVYREKTGCDLLEDASWMWRQSDIRKFPSALLRSLRRTPHWATYVEKNHALFEAILKASGASTVVDSNKEFTRALLILRALPESKIVHLHRSGKSVIASTYYRVRHKNLTFKFLKRVYRPRLMLYPAMMLAALGWSCGIALGVLIKLLYPSRVFHLCYERLVSEPQTELQRLGDFLSLNVEAIVHGIAAGKAFPVGHNIGGNELREAGTFTFLPNRKGRRHLPWVYSIGVMVLAAPGYLLRRIFLQG